MRLHRQHSRTKLTQIGVPTAVLGVLASALSAAPATAATAAETDSTPLLVSFPQAMPSAASTTAASGDKAPARYTVKVGDTVSSIASRFGLSTVDVLTWNNLSWRSVIYPGQTLSLVASGAAAPASAPATTSSTKTHTVVAGDTLFGIARKYDTSLSAILKTSGLSRDSIIYPGQKISVASTSKPASAPAPTAPAAAPTEGKTHTVVAGDTIFALAKKYDITVNALLTVNELSPSSIIYPGQSLTVIAAPASGATTKSATLNAPQAENAALIIRIGRELGVPDRGIAIALAAAMVESGLRNLDWGDRDSLGLFQQRPSTGWGAPERILDRGHSIRAFFGGPSDPNGTTTRGLLDIPGWESKSFTGAAQAVQISAFPDRYGQWEAQAYEWLAHYG